MKELLERLRHDGSLEAGAELKGADLRYLVDAAAELERLESLLRQAAYWLSRVNGSYYEEARAAVDEALDYQKEI